MVESAGQKLKAWRKAVQVAIWGKQSFKGAVYVQLGFYLRRPRADFGKSGLKARAPRKHTKRPDIDKLTRAVLDAMVDAGAIEDDSFVTELHANKWWADDDKTGCKIVVDQWTSNR
jgi:Holliday junction resolvase RusA-like endonuclease